MFLLSSLIQTLMTDLSQPRGSLCAQQEEVTHPTPLVPTRGEQRPLVRCLPCPRPETLSDTPLSQLNPSETNAMRSG